MPMLRTHASPKLDFFVNQLANLRAAHATITQDFHKSAIRIERGVRGKHRLVQNLNSFNPSNRAIVSARLKSKLRMPLPCRPARDIFDQ
jgi:hypothetical protein